MKTFHVMVRRTVYYYQDVEVQAKDRLEALSKAEERMDDDTAWNDISPADVEIEAMS